MNKCMGCGAVLQSTNINEAGYCPSMSEQTTLCQRCFRIKNYNQNPKVEINEEKFESLLHSINIKNSSVYLVVDIFDIYGSISKLPKNIKHHSNLTIILNKVDLLPREIKKPKIIQWATKVLRHYSIDFKKIIPFSAFKNLNIGYLKSYIEKDPKKEIYIIGLTNVGKSSLINALLKEEDIKPIISHFPNTTLSKVELKLNDKIIIDTPGLRNDGNFAEKSISSDLPLLLVKSRYKPRTYQLNDGQTIFIDKSIRVDFSTSHKINVTFYVPNTLNLHRCKTENADENWKNESLFKLQTSFTNFDKFTFAASSHHPRMSITISGIGFLSFNVQEFDLIEVYAPEGVSVYSQEVLL